MLPWISKIKAPHKAALAFFAILAVFVFFIFVFVGFTSVTYAQDVFGTEPIKQNIVLSGMDIRVIVVRIINVALGLLGIITLGLIIYAGFLIMTSGGEENKVTQGKKILSQAVIGLAIILSAFAIVQFIFKMLSGGGDGAPSGEAPPGLLTFSGSGALGKVIKDHYPFKDQVDVPRNTSIVVTFSIPIDPHSIAENTNRTCWLDDFSGPTSTCVTISDKTSVTAATLLSDIQDPYYGDCIDDNNPKGITWSNGLECDQINTSTFVFDEKDILDVAGKNTVSTGLEAAFLASYENMNAATGPELYTIVIKPFEYLGNAQDKVWYSVDLRTGINQKGGNVSLFDGLFSKHYYWNFETGTGLDLDPPHIISVFPEAGSTIPKNTILQINFDEAVDPTMVQGYFSQTSNFKNILVNNFNEPAGFMVTGTWKITNGYKTVEFVTDNPCGQNSCGEIMFCLQVDCADPEDTTCTNPYEMLVRTAEPTQNSEAPFEAKPFSGVYDLAFNGLDNVVNKNETNGNVLIKPSQSIDKIIHKNDEHKPDYYWWNFTALNKIDRIAPYVERTTPGVDTEDVGEEADLQIGFSKLMWISTLGIPNMNLNEFPKNICADGTDTCGNAAKLDDIRHVTYADTIYPPMAGAISTRAIVKHRIFGPNDLDLYYFPTVSSSVKSNTQNCLYPGYGPLSATNVPLETTLDQMPLCSVLYNDAGDQVVSDDGCVQVDMASNTDTGCAYTDPYSISSDFVAENVDACVDTLNNTDLSPYTYKK